MDVNSGRNLSILRCGETVGATPQQVILWIYDTIDDIGVK